MQTDEERTLKPGVPHPGLLPSVISLNPSRPLVYNSGLRKPRVGSPFASLASFRSATMPAKVGADAEVPPIEMMCPFQNIRKRRPCAATSGKAYVRWKSAKWRIVLEKRFLLVHP